MDLRLIVVSGGRQAGLTISVPRLPFFIGRSTDCQLRPRSALVSRNHCVLVRRCGRLLVQDLGSSNGTMVNEEAVNEVRELVHGDRLRVGPLTFQVCCDQRGPHASLGTKAMPTLSNGQPD
jgi:pSer/pThr/pTyr-binding forkhead associated (FHA) protein